ncbi:MAG: hypothetical protein E6Q61_02550 [Nitrosomonas sp.]|nr:MAG: hypothetical protein E6Q61_02550 [Nitrosomonas sp.]
MSTPRFLPLCCPFLRVGDAFGRDLIVPPRPGACSILHLGRPAMPEKRKSAIGCEPMTPSTATSKANSPASVLSLQEVRAAHRRIRKLLRRPRHARRA